MERGSCNIDDNVYWCAERDVTSSGGLRHRSPANEGPERGLLGSAKDSLDRGNFIASPAPGNIAR